MEQSSWEGGRRQDPGPRAGGAFPQPRPLLQKGWAWLECKGLGVGNWGHSHLTARVFSTNRGPDTTRGSGV